MNSRCTTPSIFIRRAASTALYALFLIALNHPAFAQWTQASGTGNSSIGCVAASGTAMVACSGASKPDTIFISTSNGNSWSVACTNVPMVVTSIVNVGTAFIAGSDRPGGSSYSTNFGGTWNPNILDFPYPPITDYGIYSLAVIGDTIFAGTGVGVYQQASPGAAWMPDTTGMEYSGQYPNIGSFLVSGSNFFAGAQDAGAYISTNGGASWAPVDNGLPTSYYYGTTVDAFTAIGTTLFAAILDTDQINTDIYSTTNNGQSWGRANLQPQNWGNVYGFISSGQHLFVACDNGVYVSSDNGADWVQSNLGLPISNGNGRYIISMDTSGANLVIGTFSNGVWTRKLSDFGSASVTSNTSASSNAGLSLTISENPASDAGTKIVVTLNNGGLTQVLLMDELGRAVRMLQNGYAPIGSNQILLDPLALEPGTYFVRATANGVSAMQKLVITR